MSKADLDRALELVRATDGIEFTRKKVEEYLDRARGVLPGTIPEEVKTAYVMAADFVAGRKF
jgi:heptaprenyl diphosphate synthase